MLKLLLKLNPDSKPVDLDPYLIKGRYSRTVTIAAEDDLNNFRGSQISLSLDNKNQTFTNGQLALAGGEEVSVVRPNGDIVWSGTVDPAFIPLDPDQKQLDLKVLQHGSLLNKVYAGLPDWSVDEHGNLTTNTDYYFRYKGKADNWKRTVNSDGFFRSNEIDTENADVYYTPSARDALDDELYKSKFTERTYLFHTAGPSVGDVEWTTFQANQPPNEDGASADWMSQFQPHYRPDFTVRPEYWEQEGNIVQDRGAFLRNQTPTRSLYRQSIQSLLVELIRQFNRTAKFPLLFDPDLDCVVIPPQISAEIELLKRSHNVDFVDIEHRIYFNTLRIFVLVNWRNTTPRMRGEMDFSLFYLENETELVPLFDRALGHESNCWPEFNSGFRFARTNKLNFYTSVYALQHVEEPIPGFYVHSAHVALSNLQTISPVSYFARELPGEYTDHPLSKIILNRSAAFVASGVQAGEANVRGSSPPYAALPPEQLPQQQIDINNRVYRYNNGGVTVSGALFDRVSVDAENARLSALISDLAKLTHSRWWVTPDRRLKFISRQSPGAVHDLSGSHLLQGFSSFSRSFDESDIPDIGSSLVVPDNFRYAHRNWMEDHLLGTAVKGFTANLNLEDLTELPTVGDTLLLDDPDVPDIANALLKNKYGRQFLVDQAVLDIDNETVELTATHPTV